MMKKLLVLSATVLCFFATLNESALGQTKSKNNFFAGKPGENRVEMLSQSASSDGQSGALIEWQTSYEVNNMGFNIYRIVDGSKKVLVNQDIISGSALMFGNDKVLKAGYSYTFYDKDGSLDNQYLIEAVTMNGNIQNFSNFNTSYVADFKQLVPESANADKSSDLTTNSVSQNIKPAPIASEQKTNSLSDQDTQRWVAAQPGVLISVCEPSFNVNRLEAPNCKGAGIYRVSKAQLQTGGFDVTVPVDRWALYAGGIEQAINVFGDVDANGRLGDNGYIEFFGRGVDTIYTNAKAYYLIVGAGGGKRMKASNVRALPTKTTSPSYPAFAIRQDKTAYRGNFLNGDASNYFGATVSIAAGADSTILGDTSPGAKYKFTLNAVNTQSPVVVDVSMQGLTAGVHNIDVYLNNTKIGTLTCYQSDGTVRPCVGQELMKTSFNVSGSLLLEGQNVVKILPTASGDTSFADSIKISFGRGFRALNNSVAFTTINGRGATLGGFSNQNIRVFDIADQNNVGFVKNRVSAVAGGTFSAFVQATRARTMFAVTDDAVFAPLSIVKNNTSDLLTTASNKDLVIITHKNFLAQAEELANYRRSQNLTVSVVDVDDAFDEFSFGESGVAGIGNFIIAAKPKNALLFGDATIDARNFNYTAIPNYIPTSYADTGNGEVATDEKIVDFDGDAIADNVNVGRLSVRTVAEAQTQVTKIKDFEAGIVSGTNPMQQRGALLVSDENLDYDFIDSTNKLLEHMPAGLDSSCINFRSSGHPGTSSSNCTRSYDKTTGTETRDLIISEVNTRGPFIISYTGHGTNASWSGGNILNIRRGSPTVDDTASFTNGGSKLSLFILLTCLNGGFADAFNESFSERQMKNPNGGGIGVWSSSGLTVAIGQDQMGAKFYDLYRDGVGTLRLGNLTRQAKLNTNDFDVRHTWVLLGDPTLKIK